MKSFTMILGALLLGIAAFIFWREQTFLSSTEKATGTVVDLDYSSDSDGGGSYCPVIEFSAANGQKVRYPGNVCSSPPSYDLGEPVDVIYDPADVGHVQMDNFWSKYVGAFVMAVIGLPIFLLGLVSMFAGPAKPGKK